MGGGCWTDWMVPRMRNEKILTSRYARGRYTIIAAQRLAAVCLAGAIIGCQGPPGSESNPPSQASHRASPGPAVLLTYVCGNDFDLQNVTATALTVNFAVADTSEQGELVLPPRSAESTPSPTRLTTLSTGALQLSTPGTVIAPVANAGTPCPPKPR